MPESIGTVQERGWFRPILAVLLIVHGAIHIIAPLLIWELAELGDLDGEPTVAMSATSTDVLGVAWLVVLVAFAVAGIGVLLRRGWWGPVAIVSVVASQILIVLWWEGAWRGTIANVLIFAAVWIVLKERRAAKGEG